MRTSLLGLLSLALAACGGAGDAPPADAGVDGELDARTPDAADAEPHADGGCPSRFRPMGCRAVPSDAPALPSRSGWHNVHGDVTGSDEVSIVVGPEFAEDWSTEGATFNVTGPVFDSAGNLYFAPLLPAENVALISLSPEDGARRFAVESTGAFNGGGAPIVLVDPESGDDQILLGLYDRAFALDSAGTRLWDVATGLVPEAGTAGDAVFGLNYHPQTDSVVGLARDGLLYVLDRATGAQRLAAPYSLPGEPSPAGEMVELPAMVVENLRAELAPFFGSADLDPTILLAVLLGNDTEVANFFSIDPHDGTVWIAATAPDAEDGTVDGVSDLGALYALEFVAEGDSLSVIERCHASFEGGSASTPALRTSGGRVYLGDNDGLLLAIEPDCSVAWSVDVGGQILGSIGVAADGDLLFASTATSVVKVRDDGAAGALVWSVQPDVGLARPGEESFNLNLVTVADNGLAFQAGAGRLLNGATLARSVGVGLLDRETGEVRSFTEGLDETVAVMSIGIDGGIYIGNSPLRRAIYRAVFGGGAPLRGGITRFVPSAWDRQLVDATCAGEARANNAADQEASCPDSAAADAVALRELAAQARAAGERAVAMGQLDDATWDGARGHLDRVDTALAGPADLVTAAAAFTDARVLVAPD